MATVRVVLNKRAVGDILKSSEVVRDLRRRAESIAAAAGPGHRVFSEVGRNRARAAVVTTSNEAKRKEATSRNLTRSIQAAR